DQYHLLGISRKEFAMFIGTRYEIEQINMPPHILSTFKDAIGEDYEEKVVQATGGGPNNEIRMHGQGSRKDIIQKETKKFFRIADNEIITYFSQQMRLSVILVALVENQAMYQEICKIKYLIEKYIK